MAGDAPNINGSAHPTFAGPAVCEAAGEALDLRHAARIVAIIKAANRLASERHMILFLEPGALSVKPVIWIANDERLWALVKADQASYYATGTDALGAYRIGQFQRDDVIVKWIERGH